MGNSSTNANAAGLKKSKYFEIFGYDFMVDVNKDLWLIEVNTNPCLEQSCQFLKMIMPRMLDDAFKLTIDKTFVKNTGNCTEKPHDYPVDGYSNSENLWEMLDMFNNE